jgi:glycosyltransferase involved in cell wall biosynthesis
MLILMVHNYYQRESPSGECISFENEVEMLRMFGHRVITYTRENTEIAGASWWKKAAVARETVWSRRTYRELKELFTRERPAVAHFQNTFPLISPTAYLACREEGIPVIQKLGNYRLLCPGAMLYRNSQVCEDCLGKTFPWPGVAHACYRESRLETAVVAAMLTVHRSLKTWRDQVDIYITPSEFIRRKFIEAGLPPEKTMVKPNFVYPDPGVNPHPKRDYAIFVGRISPEKGVGNLLEAWRSLPGIPLKIVGEGPLGERMRSLAQSWQIDQVEFTGQLAPEAVMSLIGRARFLVFPSQWYEAFGRVAIEAFACGVPVIVSQIGSIAEIVKDRVDGLYFSPGNPEALAAKVHWAWTHPQEMQEMGRRGRQEYEEKYTIKKCYEKMMEIFQNAISTFNTGLK